MVAAQRPQGCWTSNATYFLYRRSATKLKESAERTDVAESRRPVLFFGGREGGFGVGRVPIFASRRSSCETSPHPLSNRVLATFSCNFWVSWFHVCFLLLCFFWLIVFFPAYLGAWLWTLFKGVRTESKTAYREGPTFANIVRHVQCQARHANVQCLHTNWKHLCSRAVYLTSFFFRAWMLW